MQQTIKSWLDNNNFSILQSSIESIFDVDVNNDNIASLSHLSTDNLNNFFTTIKNDYPSSIRSKIDLKLKIAFKRKIVALSNANINQNNTNNSNNIIPSNIDDANNNNGKNNIAIDSNNNNMNINELFLHYSSMLSNNDQKYFIRI